VLRSHWRILVDYSGIFEVFITWRVAGLRLKVEVQDVSLSLTATLDSNNRPVDAPSMVVCTGSLERSKQSWNWQCQDF
jgi:hypothetical protein